MANTTFNTRIQNKIDTYENYEKVKTRFIPLKGEVCIATVSTQVGGVQSPPQTLIKIGDGKSTWENLKWLSATAADVKDSLKGSDPTLPATSITGLNEYISGQIQDTNTQYRLVASGTMGIQLQSKEKGEEDTAFKNVGTPITLTPPTYSLIPGDTNGTVKFGITGSEQAVKVHGLGSAAYTDSGAYDPAGTGASEAGKVKTALVGTGEDTSALDTIKGAKKYADEKASTAQSAAESAANSYTDEEIAALSSEGKTAGAGEVISKVTQANGVITVEKKTLTEADIPAIPTSKVTNLDTTLAGKQNTLVFNTPYDAVSNKAATMTDVQNSIQGLSGAMHYIGESEESPAEGTVTIENKPDYSPAAGDVVTYQKKEFVYDGEAWRELGDESSFAVKGSIKDADIASDANIAQSKIAGLEAALAEKVTSSDITSAIESLDVAVTSVTTGKKITSIEEVDGKIQVLTGAIVADDIPELPTSKITGLDTTLGNKADSSTVTAVNSRIDNLNNNDAEVDGKFVVSAVQTDGLVAVTRKKVNIAKLEQTSGEYIIFNCGNASTNV